MSNENEQIIQIIENPLALTTQPNEVMYKLYKLRRKSDGLYSTGGLNPSWSAKGKAWNTLAALSGHLAQHRDDLYNKRGWGTATGTPWNDIEIVVLEVRENDGERQECAEYVSEMQERRAKREAAAKMRAAKVKLETTKRDYERAIRKAVEDFQGKYGI